jgi:hypothetical protein
MKFILISLFLIFSLYGDEIQRLESIVKEITKLRVDYEECRRELEDKQNVKMGVKVLADNENKNYKELLKIKDKKIKTLENELKRRKKTRVIVKKQYENSNKFPKLTVKHKFIEKKPKKPKRASIYRLKEDSDIYNKISGTKIQRWEKGRSFTSNKMSKNWIKITGYFVDKQWTKAKYGMWIQKIKVIKR